MAGEPQDDGWETVTDPTEIQKVLGKNGANKVLGLTSGGPGSGGGKAATEGERKAAVLATRLAGGVSTLNAIGQDGARPGLFQAIVRGALGDTAANYLTGDDRQRVEAAQGDILDAALTLGTGAAYTKEQLEGYRKAYFPQLGDSDATVRDKRERLKLLLQSARIGSGSAAPQIESALKAAGFPVQQEGGDQASGAAGAASVSGQPPADPPPQNRDAGGAVMFNDELPQTQAAALRLTDEQFAQFQALAQSGATADALAGMATAFGRAPDEEGRKNLEAIAAYYAKPENRKTPLGVSYQRDELKPVETGDGALGAAARGAGNVLTLGLGDEAGAIFDTVSQGGTYDENVDRRRGQELYDEQEHGVARGAGQIVGGLPLGGVGVAAPRVAARAAFTEAVRAGRTAVEARAIANRVFAARTALDAAGLSGAYSAGDADGDLGERALAGGVGAATGALAGGALSLGGGAFARRLAMRRRAAPTRAQTDGQAALAAMERQGITPFAPDVGGGAVRRAASTISQTIPGVQPLIAGARRTLDTAQAVRDRVAASLGTPVNVEATGEAARAGANAYRARTSARIGRIYDAAEAAGGQARVSTPEALRVLNQELAPLRESPVQGAGVSILEGLRERLAGDVTVRGLRNARSVLREEFENNGLRRSNVERIANRVLDAAADDVANGLSAQGLDTAARQYRVADRMWRERLQVIDEYLDPILGDAQGAGAKSGEQIVKGLKAAMAGNNRRFSGFIGALPPQEQQIVRASLISRLGQASKGQQDEGGEVFSLGTFLTNWNDIGERAKDTLFGTEGRAALNDLAIAATASKEAQRYANHSNTGGVAGNLLTAASGLGGIQTLGTALALQYGAGRLLASPRFARWLARPPRAQTPQSQAAYVARLTRIARAEPAIANDILDLQRRLAESFGAPARLAADERDQERNGIVGQDQERRENREQPSATP